MSNKKPNANWYSIPGFLSYDIHIRTKQIRSNKHYNTMRYHIMKVKNGTVKLVDDKGVRQRVRVDDIYDLTFNQGHPLLPRGDFEYKMGSMMKINRSMDSNVNILTGQVEPISTTTTTTFIPSWPTGMIKPFRYE